MPYCYLHALHALVTMAGAAYTSLLAHCSLRRIRLQRAAHYISFISWSFFSPHYIPRRYGLPIIPLRWALYVKPTLFS